MFVALGVVSCAWVKTTPRGQEVELLTEADVVNCVKKGVTSSKTLSRIILIPRNRQKVYNELVTLAKNEAAVMQGDSIVPQGEVKKGALDFVVYHCRE